MATLTAYYFRWYSPNSGDYYDGLVYDDGTYGYAVGQTVYGPNSRTESGAANGYYCICGAVSANTSGYSVGNVTGSPSNPYYYDAQTGLNLPRYATGTSVLGTAGLGSESDYAYYSPSSTTLQSYYFGNDYYEADYRFGTLTAYQFYWYSPNSGDYYGGTVYDDGRYGYAVGQYVYGPHANTETGAADGYYRIFASSNATNSGRSAGEVTGASFYYDAQSGRCLPTYYGGGTLTGNGGLGSEYDYVDNGPGYDLVGRDYYEADGAVLTAYKFWWYSPNSGDYYYGTVYDDGTYGYAVGQEVRGPYTYTESGTADGYYRIYGISAAGSAGRSAGDVTTGNADFGYYYDADTGRNLSLYYGSSTVVGSQGLGSECNYTYYYDGSKYQYEYVGGDYYEADAFTVSGHIYYYTATDTVSGDIQYGYVYDDASHGYYNGYSFYSANESGGYWHYEIYASAALSYDRSLTGKNYVSSYYDGETGISDTPYNYQLGYAAGSSGLGSGSDEVDFGTGVYEKFSSYYEADLYGATTDRIYYYYAYNTGSGDTYWGYVYDDGKYGYYPDLSTYFYASDDDGVGYTFYDIYDSVDLGYNPSKTGYNYVSSYYDGETGRYGTAKAYAAGNPSGYSGLGSEYDTVDFGSGQSSAFGYGYYEADPV